MIYTNDTIIDPTDVVGVHVFDANVPYGFWNKTKKVFYIDVKFKDEPSFVRFGYASNFDRDVVWSLLRDRIKKRDPK